MVCNARARSTGCAAAHTWLRSLRLQVTLLKLLKAYEVVLRKHSIQAAEDTYYYRLLLKLSLDPNPDWWAKLAHERELAFRQVPLCQWG